MVRVCPACGRQVDSSYCPYCSKPTVEPDDTSTPAPPQALTSRPRRYHTWVLAAAALAAAVLLLAVGVRTWCWATSRELLTFRGNDRFYSVAFSPDGKRLAATAARIVGVAAHDWDMDPTARPLVTVWDATSGQQLYTLQMSDAATALCAAFSPDGEWLAVASDDREAPVKTFNAATGQ